MIIFAADHPLVLDGTYDREGYKPGERELLAQRARRRNEETMAKRTAKKPKQQDLIEDRAIKPLEDVATEYAEIRDQRMALNEQEGELKKKAMRLMKKYDKREYRHDGIEIQIVDGEEDIKVRVKKPKDGADTDEAADDAGAGAEA